MNQGRLIFGAVTVTTLLTLTGCFGGTPSGDGTKTAPPSGSPTASTGSPTPTSSGDPVPTATELPTDCLTLVSQADPATFGSTPLNSPTFNDLGPTGVKAQTAPVANATPIQIMRALGELSCLWANPNTDITHLRIDVGHVATDVSAGMVTGLEADGYACAGANGGTQCAITTPNTQFPVDDNFTYLVRDDVVIMVDQTNFPTNNLMGSMVSEIWG